MNIKNVVLTIAFVGATLSLEGIGLADAKHEVFGKNRAVPKATLEAIGVQMSPFLNYEPFDPPLLNHLWMKTDSDKMIFFHFEKPAGEKENKLLFTGDAIKGRFCAEDQPEGGKSGYVHFHSAQVATGHEHGHGGKAGQEGYWLRHIALGEFDMMNIHFRPGLAYNFKATPAPICK